MTHPGAPAAVVTLNDDERETLERWAHRPKSAQALALRCRIVLACADGGSNTEIAARLGITHGTAAKWRTSMGCMTNRVRVHRAQSATTMSNG